MFKCVIPCYIKSIPCGLVFLNQPLQLETWQTEQQTDITSSKKTDVWQDFVCCEENLKFIQTRFCAFPDPMKRVLYFFFLHFQLYIHCIKGVEVIRKEKGLWRSSLRRATYWTMKQTNPVLSGFQAKFEYDVGWSLTKWSRFCFQRNFN